MSDTDLTLPSVNTLRRLDLEGTLEETGELGLLLNGAVLGEVLAYGLTYRGKRRRRWGRVRITVERIGE